jgi:hypothetical protein
MNRAPMVCSKMLLLVLHMRKSSHSENEEEFNRLFRLLVGSYLNSSTPNPSLNSVTEQELGQRPVGRFINL